MFFVFDGEERKDLETQKGVKNSQVETCLKISKAALF